MSCDDKNKFQTFKQHTVINVKRVKKKLSDRSSDFEKGLYNDTK